MTSTAKAIAIAGVWLGVGLSGNEVAPLFGLLATAIILGTGSED